jgi:hypothetical protein
MMKPHQFKIEIYKLNRRITVERSLDDFLNQCLINGVESESHHEATKELLKRYMSVVRSRNKVRRNWHPEQARACDELTIALITKDEFKKSAVKILQKALVVTTNGTKVILEDTIKELSQELADEAYKRKQKKRKPTPLKEIVIRIHRSNPEVTNTDVITEMRSDQRKYSIVNMDDKYVEIEVLLGSGKDSKIIRRSLRSIGKILTDLNNP